MDISCMSSRDENATALSQPKKLYKPRREPRDLKADEVVTYMSECDPVSADPAAG